MMPDLSLEASGWQFGARFIAGLDEVGRGPLAGPVTAAAVVLAPDAIPEGLDDSKRLGVRRRERLAKEIHATAQVAIAHVGVAEIDMMNILRASHRAMMLAVQMLDPLPDLALVDGRHIPQGLPCRGRAVVKGDTKSLSIAAASIVAKVERDRIMVDLAQQHPGYGWEHNAGYPTAEHKRALRDLGVTPHHRRSFAPVRNILYQGNFSTP